MSTLRDQLLAPRQFKTAEFDLDGWGVVRIRELTAGQLVFLTSLNGDDQQTAGRIYSKLGAMSLVDESGSLVFDCDDDADIDALQTKPWSALEELANTVIAFNGFGSGQVEARAKNSRTRRKK